MFYKNTKNNFEKMKEHVGMLKPKKHKQDCDVTLATKLK